MATRRATISLPEKLLTEVDRAAAERGESRSEFIVRMLRRVVRARSDAEISRRVNALYADPELVRQTRLEAAQWETVGTKWEDEPW